MMILDSRTSSSDREIKNRGHNKKSFKIRTLYVGMICFATNCLSTITLETASCSLFRSISSTRFSIFNNLFRRNYNLRIKILITNVLTAMVSTIMLTIGDIFGIPYFYLPWLVHTIEGMVFYEGPALFELAYTMLPSAGIPAGLLIFITLLLYVVELCIWKDVFVSFRGCWTSYDKNKKLEAELAETTNKDLRKENNDLGPTLEKSKDQQESINHSSNFYNKNLNGLAVRSVKTDLSIGDRSRNPFIELTG